MNIHPSIKKLAKPISVLTQLENNPRRGDIDAIAASYQEFGQVKPIVARDNGDGTFTVIAGNHQVQAAKKLGWQEIAVVVMDVEDTRAIAFALADNRTMELGHSDQSQIIDMITQISSEYPALLEELRWDEFEMAAMTEWQTRNGSDDDSEDIGGYVAPVMINNLDDVDIEEAVDGGIKLSANKEVNPIDAVTRGSNAVGVGGSSQAVVQYTLVFDNPEQQKNWYQFIRFLRSSTVYEGSTTAERLMEFVNQHADF